MEDPKYLQLIRLIRETLESGRGAAIQAVNRSMVEAYWTIGKHIVEFEQGGSERAVYGSGLLKKLSEDLRRNFDKGFSHSNINAMRTFYLQNPILQAVPAKLSWTMLVELQKIEDPLEKSFYQQQALLENWSWRELKRQKESMLFHRLALSKDKEGVLALSKEGHVPRIPEDLMKDPYVLEFLKIPEPYHIREKDLEQRIIKHLKQFLLELGKGFAFIGEQYRISLGNRHYYVDLVFYHRILKCFVLIDLKRKELNYSDIGQMNMYMGYFENEENTEGDNPPIGIVLAHEKDDLVVKYAMSHLSSNLLVAKYQLYLPDREELQRKLEDIINSSDDIK